MRNSLFNGLTEVCTMVGNMTNIPPVPCMGTPTHYGIYYKSHSQKFLPQNSPAVYEVTTV